jgi:YVTN family beta-propeller protein
VIDIRSNVVTLQIESASAYFLAINPRDPHMAILEAGGAVRILDHESRGTIAGFTLPGAPARAAYGSGGRRVFFSDPAANAVYARETGSYTALPTIAVPGAPVGLATHSSLDRLYVVQSAANSVRVVNLLDGTTIATIPVGASPSDIVVDPTGARAYVSVRGANSVAVLDLVNNIVVATVPVGLGPEGIDITPSGEFVYVVNNTGNNVSVVSTSALTSVASIAIGTGTHSRGRFIGGSAQQPPSPPGPLTGLWWNPNESGWGVHLTQRRDIIFAAWFTYDAAGTARWYVASDCRMQPDPACPTCANRSICTGTIYETRGSYVLQDSFSSSVLGGVGSMAIRFADLDNGTLEYTVNGESRSASITRQLFAAGPAPGTNYTDLWWNPLESGWGIGITQQDSIMFLTWFVYDQSGRPAWYIASRCEVNASGNGCSGRIYRTSGPLGAPRFPNGFDTRQLQVEDVGEINVAFTGENDAVMTYVLHGSAGSKTITRQFF